MIWMNASATVHESTLAHSLNLLGVPTLVLEMGQGHDIHRSFGNQIVDGIFHIMSEMDIWEGPEPVVQEPAVSSDGEVEFIRSACVPAVDRAQPLCEKGRSDRGGSRPV